MIQMFISDLHLDESKPEISSGFFKFMNEQAISADSLYVLGDLFEVWLGDDHESAFNRSVTDAFAAFEGDLYFMHGNRDFLLGQGFCSATGGKLLDDPLVVDCHGRPALLMHGDSLCTDDVDYMTARKTLRDPAFQAELLNKSLPDRAAFAANARSKSGQHTRETTMDIMDVNQQAVTGIMTEHKVDLLIHGHTHRPQIHNFSLTMSDHQNQNCQRIVLGDWDQNGWVLRYDNDGYELKQFPLG
jgi:UDP-2,3-diacylglucosamine hydrolase